jgi:hypothetical protein
MKLKNYRTNRIGHCKPTAESTKVVQTGFSGKITLLVAQTVNTEQPQHYIYPRNVVYFRCKILNILHNGDNKYNNNNKLTHIACFSEDIQHHVGFVYIL